MTVVDSSMLPLQTIAPNFKLLDTISNQVVSLEELKGKKATVIMFICNHCPFVKHIQHELVNLANDFNKKDVSFIAISSNDIENYPADAPDKMQEVAQQLQYPFPYLYDETQAIAKAYKAMCTPDFFIFDANLKCAYRGQMDDSRPGRDIPVTGKDLRAALDSVLADRPVDENQKPSQGCNIKWK